MNRFIVNIQYSSPKAHSCIYEHIPINGFLIFSACRRSSKLPHNPDASRLQILASGSNNSRMAPLNNWTVSVFVQRVHLHQIAIDLDGHERPKHDILLYA